MASQNSFMTTLKEQWSTFSKQVEQKYTQALTWLTAFFKQIDTYEIIAVCAISIGFILLIIGIILL